MSVNDRFWSKVAVAGEDDCWPWRASCNSKGYGNFKLDGTVERAHRVAWKLANNKDVQIGQNILHSCDNPPCCNPAHLWPGTQLENIADRHAKGRSRGGGQCGTDRPNSKLEDRDVISIKKRYAEGRISQRSLASEFGINPSVVSRICAGKNWKHLEFGASQ